MPSRADLEMVAKLVKLPEWEALRRVWNEMQDRHWGQIAREFATKNKQPDYATLQWDRGYSSCGNRMLRMPGEAASKLLRDDNRDGEDE